MNPSGAESTSPLIQWLGRLLRIAPGEWTRFLLAFSYFFILLGGYFMLRPLRGTVAAANSDQLHWLYTATFIVMLALVPLFGWLVAHFRRSLFIPASYLFFAVNLGCFALAFTGPEPSAWVQRAFYVWLSVFNLFVVSVFWSFMADIFRVEQAERLFGSIMAGGTLGAIVGPLVTAAVIGPLGPAGVMAIALVCLLLATCMAILLGREEAEARYGQPPEIIGGGVLEGAITVFRSPYLLLICLMMLSHNLVSTFLYNGLAVLVNDGIPGFAERTRFFSYVDFMVQVLAFSLQFLLLSRLLSWVGLTRTALLPPLLLAGGLTLLGGSMGLVLFAAVQVVQRSLNYGLLGPVKELLFTVVDRQTKYKSKNFIDTVIYRGSDVAASWLFKGCMAAGLSMSAMALAYLPVLLGWSLGVWRLGRRFELLRAQAARPPNAG